MTILAEPATGLVPDESEVGSVFVSNYPPFSFWKAEQVAAAEAAFAAPPRPGADLGLYLHVPFCRKRCKFCYFRVYTDKNASEIGLYLDALAREVEGYAGRPAIAGRPLRFDLRLDGRDRLCESLWVGWGEPDGVAPRMLSSYVAGSGTSFTLQEPLADFRGLESNLFFIQRLDHAWTYDNHHEAGMAQLFTGGRFYNDTQRYSDAPSIDQILLKNSDIRGGTPIASVHVSAGGGGGMPPRPAMPMGGGGAAPAAPKPSMPSSSPSPQPYRPAWARDDDDM